MAPRLLVLVYGSNSCPAEDCALKYFGDHVQIIHIQNDWLIEYCNEFLNEYVRACRSTILMVCNCPSNLRVPKRTSIALLDTDTQPCVRQFVCAQSIDSLPGQGQIPATCELLLCTNSIPNKLTDDAQRYLHSVLMATVKAEEFTFSLLPV